MNLENLKNIIECIHTNKPIDEAIWTSCLMQVDVHKRLYVNQKLAIAFMKIDNFQQATIHAERAWTLSNFSTKEATIYVEILQKMHNIDRIVYVYKQTGIAEKKRLHYESAINYFQRAWYAKALYEKKDSFDYDFEILEAIYQIASSFQSVFEIKFKKDECQIRKTRIAYLAYGFADEGSVFAKFIPLYAKYHDLKAFEVTFFVPNREEYILYQEFSKKIIQTIEACECHVVCASNEQDRFKRWVDFSQKICEFQPDLFITFAGLACLENYFIASTLPGYIRKIALVYGPPAQFIPPTFDHAMGTTVHPLFDSLIESSLNAPILLEQTYFSNKRYSKEDFQIPSESLVVCSCGRYTKFQEDLFWEILLATMSTHLKLYFLCIGPCIEDIKQLVSWPKNILQRCRFLGWQSDASNILECGDIYINTFPNGGGYTVVEAIERNLPVISFEHNYFQKFDQTCWNPIKDFIDVKEMLIPQWDKLMFISRLAQLIQDAEFRRNMAQACLSSLRKKMPTPEQSMQNYEVALKKMVL